LLTGLLLAGWLGFGSGFIGSLRLDAQPTAYITWNGESAVVKILGTEEGKNYQILSKTDLFSAPWILEQNVAGAVGQDWTQTIVPMEGRPSLYMVAGYGEDSDGDGLSDIYEILVTRTSPNLSDTGNTGVDDGYRDSDGDGWTNIDEYRNRTGQAVFDTPPPPQIISATLDSTGTKVTLSWESAVPASQCVIKRGNPECYDPDDGYSWCFDDAGRVGPGVTDFTDTAASVLLGSPNPTADYYVSVQYTNGIWVNSSIVSVAKESLWSEAGLIRGPNGHLHLIIKSAVPNLAGVRLFGKQVIDPDTGQVSYPSFEVPASALVNGISALPQMETERCLSFFSMAQGITTDGRFGKPRAVYYSGLGANWPEHYQFVDGSTHLNQNLRFQLRSATKNRRFGCYLGSIDFTQPSWPSAYGLYHQEGPHDYEFADFLEYDGFLPTWFANQQLPVEQHYLWRNFIFNSSDVWTSGFGELLHYGWPVGSMHFATGARYLIDEQSRVVYNPKYQFTESFSASPPLAFKSADSKWVYYRDVKVPDDQPSAFAELDLLPFSDGRLGMAAGLQNVYGLPITSVLILNSNQLWILPSGGIVGPLDVNESSAYFTQTDEPVLETVGYYFSAGDVLGMMSSVPGDPQFTTSHVTPLLVAGCGEPILVAGWAKKRIVNGYADKFAYLGQYFDKAFKVDTNTGQRTMQETGLLSEYGEFFPTEPGRVILTTKPDADQGDLQGECLIHIIKLELDVNHDGVIDRSFSGPDNTSYDRPFRFWINNDCDSLYGTERNQPSVPDSWDDVIYAATTRDLEDFARLWISGLPSLPSHQGFAVKLGWRNDGGPAIRLFQAFEEDGGTRYLTDYNAASEQATFGINGSGRPYGYGAGLGVVAPSTSFEFPADFFANRGRKHFIFEGISAGRGELVLTIEKNGQPVAETSVWMELLDIKDMYERAHIFNVTDDSPNRLVSLQRFDKMLPIDHTESKHVIAFVHGWNMGQWDYENFSETMYKRLWWQGYRGRFVAVRWPTLSADTDGAIGRFFTYNKSEFRAFQSGRGVSAVLTKLRQRFPDYSINVCAHSLGNIVMAQALKQQVEGGFQDINNYVLMQAATPAHCYDPALPDYSVFMTAENRTPTPDTYRGYPGPIDKAVLSRIVNFFNENDFALATGVILGKQVHWEGNEIDFKPDSGFGYDYIDSVPRKHELFDIWQVTDPREIMAFLARPRSKAVGALRGVGGVINQAGEVDLKANFGFDRDQSEHSAQFNWNVQRTRGFYGQLLNSMAIVIQE
jgi:hypothetical protein